MEQQRHHFRLGWTALFVSSGALIVWATVTPHGPSRALAILDAGTDPAAAARQTFVAAGAPPVTDSSYSVASVGAVPDGMPFPHFAMYGGPNGVGWPFIGSTAKLGTCSNNPAIACTYNTDCGNAAITCTNSAQTPNLDAPLNNAELDLYAKFPQVILSPTPLSDHRPDIITALRARNPNIEIFAYAVGHMMWCGGVGYPDGYYYRDYWLGVTGGDTSCSSTSNRLLWNQDGTRSGYDVNLAYRELQPDNTYKYPVAEAIAEATYEHAKATRGFNGIFVDVLCPSYMWAENLANLWDYARAGYNTTDPDNPTSNPNLYPPNRTAFTAGWLAGYQAEVERLRALAIADGHPDFPIAGNCAQAPASVQPFLNGWMRENYPFQNGGTFNSNMLSWPWGYLHQDQNFRSPQFNYIFTGADPASQPYTQYNQQKLRFGLGSASLGNGYHTFQEPSGNLAVSDHPTWWYDEYGVDTTVPQSSPDFGKAKNGLAYTGWLGQPLTDYHNMLLPNANPELIPTNNFEQDISHFNLIVNPPAQATADRQTTDAAVGSGALHVSVSQTGNDVAAVLLNSDVFTTTAGSYYSVTFFARASQPRAIAAHIDGAGLTIPISTRWKQYQVSVQATGTGNAIYQFQLGHDTGDVWFDDIRVQAGASNIFRRDFDRGTVLVNPYSVPLTVPLEKPFKKILGTVNPTINDGSIVTSVTLTPNVGQGIGDAVFLVSIDTAPPSDIVNLRSE